ncbi:MAG TPA: AAA domain-containing protein [Ignavibacteriales bacterium]|nr:AAA domain-containing protein [Ignavibacteriales bacterium]
MKTTRFNQAHKNHGAKLVDFAGYEMPVQYSSIITEHKAVRESAGVFDVSHMGEFFVEGPEAEKLVNYIATNDVTKLFDGKVQYSTMLYENGGIVDDLLVYRFNNQKYMLVVNASNIEKDFEWVTKNNKFDKVFEKFNSTNIFISTISTLWTILELFNLKKFETLIVDEASQILEPQIVGILKYFDKWILIGDDNQLPAVVLQPESDSLCNEPLLNQIFLKNFRESLFYRLKLNAIHKGWNDAYGMLEYQYRMHPDIVEFPSKEFYGNKLKTGCGYSGKQEIFNNFSHPLVDVLKKTRVIFIPSVKETTIKKNDNEAEITKYLIEFFANFYENEKDFSNKIGVITPYKAQIANIKSHLNNKFQNITIDTVERFQGSERDIIIYSASINNTYQLKNLQVVNEFNCDRKLNVVLTRAKKIMVVVGNEEILKENPIYARLIDHIKHKDGYIKQEILFNL